MKKFLLGVIVGVVGDRMLMQAVDNEEILGELRDKLQQLDGMLADMAKGTQSEPEVTTDPGPIPGDPTDPAPHAGDSAL